MDGRRGKVVCHLHISGDLKKEMKRVLSGVVYMTKSRGPRTEPWGASMWGGEIIIAFDTKTARKIGSKPV